MVVVAGIPARLQLMETGRTVSLPRTAGLLAVTVVWALLLALSGSPEAILFTIPVFLIAAPLAVERYAGEQLILAMRSGNPRRGNRIPKLALPIRVEISDGIIRAGRLSGRGPPLASH